MLSAANKHGDVKYIPTLRFVDEVPVTLKKLSRQPYIEHPQALLNFLILYLILFSLEKEPIIFTIYKLCTGKLEDIFNHTCLTLQYSDTF